MVIYDRKAYTIYSNVNQNMHAQSHFQSSEWYRFSRKLSSSRTTVDMFACIVMGGGDGNRFNTHGHTHTRLRFVSRIGINSIRSCVRVCVFARHEGVSSIRHHRAHSLNCNRNLHTIYQSKINLFDAVQRSTPHLHPSTPGTHFVRQHRAQSSRARRASGHWNWRAFPLAQMYARASTIM